MSEEKVGRLVVLLLDKTVRGELRWEQTETEGVYQAAFPSYSARIASQPTREDGRGVDYVLGIYNEEGAKVHEVDDIDLREGMGGGSEAYKTMQQLYQAARRIAMGVEDAVDDILSFLHEDEEEIPF